jgi:hypothetical protein
MPFLLVALLITAVVLYLAWRGVKGNGETGGTPALRPKPRPKPVAPDDDPEFLGELDRRMHGEDKNN